MLLLLGLLVLLRLFPRRNQPYQGSLTSEENRNDVEDDIVTVHGTCLLRVSLNHNERFSFFCVSITSCFP